MDTSHKRIRGRGVFKHMMLPTKAKLKSQLCSASHKQNNLFHSQLSLVHEIPCIYSRMC